MMGAQEPSSHTETCQSAPEQARGVLGTPEHARRVDGVAGLHNELQEYPLTVRMDMACVNFCHYFCLFCHFFNCERR